MSAAAMTARQGPLAVGDRFLKFEIRSLLGHGGHGWVYHGYDPFLDRHVAIKVIPNPVERGRDLQRRAQLEARVLCKLQHRNVVHVIDAGASGEGAVYIVMELLHGRTLRDAIRDYGQLSVAEVLSLGAQIADGVQAAHDQSTIHRDLKPENVFLLEGNAVKVLDFGIAKFLGSGAATTQRDLLHGTMLYMSPEHLQGLRVTPRSDIYALGTTLYEALAGQPPSLIGMEEPTLESITFAQINRMPSPLDVSTTTVPRFVARAIHRMLAKEPADRFATMAEVAQVLRAHLQRFVNEVPKGIADARPLWRGTHSISPPSAIRLSQSTSDEHELGPTLSPTVRARPSQTGDSATPLQFLAAPVVHASVPISQRALAPLQFADARRRLPGELEANRVEPAPAPPTAITLPRLLLSAVALGIAVGVAVGLIQGVPRSEEPTAATRASTPRHAALPAPAKPSASAQPTAVAVVAPSSVSALRAAAPSTTRPASHPVVAARPSTKPVNTGPASGLTDPAPKTAKKAAVAAPTTSSSARPIHRPKAIYGSDDDAE